jgi:hypothetical protein
MPANCDADFLATAYNCPAHLRSGRKAVGARRFQFPTGIFSYIAYFYS